MKLNAGHITFRKGAALAFLRVAANPNLPIHELSGSYAGLREEFRRTGLGLKTLARMIKPKLAGGLDRLVVSDDRWSFTASGAEEYEPFISEARNTMAMNSIV